MNDKQLIITKHAYDRYCQRVGQISRDDLHTLLANQQPQRRKKDYVELGGVWWRWTVEKDVVILHTCYGRHHIDLPAAIMWAKINNDRIVLGGVYAD